MQTFDVSNLKKTFIEIYITSWIPNCKIVFIENKAFCSEITF